jgi:hypothetical protein
MDVFWIKHPGQDPVALLKKYPKRFLLMLLKDRKPEQKKSFLVVLTLRAMWCWDQEMLHCSDYEDCKEAGSKTFFY